MPIQCILHLRPDMGFEALEVLCGFGGENNLVSHSGHNIARILCRVNRPCARREPNAPLQLRGPSEKEANRQLQAVVMPHWISTSFEHSLALRRCHREHVIAYRVADMKKIR